MKLAESFSVLCAILLWICWWRLHRPAFVRVPL